MICSRLYAPATSANLGPGFDCLGLALDLWNELEVEEISGEGEFHLSLLGEGSTLLATDANHLLISVARAYLAARGVERWPSVRLVAHNRIPLARGLGSSAATRVLAIMLGQLLAGRPHDPVEVLAQVTELEGHPDNVAPAVLGGLTTSLVDPEEGPQVLAWPWHACWRLVVAIPDFPLETLKSRSVVPDQLSRSDAVFNLARLPWLLQGLAQGQPLWLARGSQDRWHQPQRQPLIAGMPEVFQAALEAGASACYLSGAGPSLAAWVDQRQCQALQVAEAMERAWAGRAKALVLSLCAQGAYIAR